MDFYFEFASPYGYLASLRIDAIAAAHGREVTWRPIMLGAALKLTGGGPNASLPLKGPYLLHDAPRFARLVDAPLRQPPVMPANSLAASRASGGWRPRTQTWPRASPRRPTTPTGARAGTSRRPSRWPRSAAPLGLEPATLIAATQDPAIKARLKEETDRSIERGVFGSPVRVRRR